MVCNLDHQKRSVAVRSRDFEKEGTDANFAMRCVSVAVTCDLNGRIAVVSMTSVLYLALPFDMHVSIAQSSFSRHRARRITSEIGTNRTKQTRLW